MLSVAAASKLGSGTIHVTNLALVYEVDGRGLYLNFIPRDIIRVSETGSLMGSKRITITWKEDGRKHSFDIRTKRHKELLEALAS